MEAAILKKEILKRGYYSLPQWTWEKIFTDAYNAEPELLSEAQPYIKELAFAVRAKLLTKEDVALNEINMPLLEKWLDRNYPEMGECYTWINLAKQQTLNKCGLSEVQPFIDGEPSWCDYLSSIWTKMVGGICSGFSEFQDWKKMSAIIEEETLRWDFFSGFQFSDATIADYLANSTFDIASIVNGSRMMDYPLEAYEIIDKTQKEIIDNLKVYEDYAGYVEMPELAVMVGVTLYEQGRMDDLYALWQKMKNPILQYRLLMGVLITHEGCLELMVEFKHRGADEVTLCLFRDYWFRQMVADIEKLLQYENPRGQVFDVQKEAQPIAASMLSEIKSHLGENAKKLLATFNVESLAKWIYGKYTLTDKPESLYKQAYISVMGAIKGVLEEEKTATIFTTDSKDMKYLLFLAQKAMDNNDEKIPEVEDAILKLIDEGKFGWYGAMNDEVVEQMETFGKLLFKTHSEQDLWGCYASRRIIYEGWRVTPLNKRADRGYSSGFIVGALLLNNQSFDFFQQLVLSAIDQLNRNNYPDDSLKAPLIIAELIVVQIKTDWREWYEQTLVEDVESLEMLLQILNYTKDGMTAGNKALLKTRSDVEWPICKRRFMDTKRSREVAGYEQLIKKLLG